MRLIDLKVQTFKVKTSDEKIYCFSFSCRSMVPCSPRSLYINILFVSGQIFFFGLLCPLTIMLKRGSILRIEYHSLGGEFHVKGKKVFYVTNLRGELV